MEGRSVASVIALSGPQETRCQAAAERLDGETLKSFQRKDFVAAQTLGDPTMTPPLHRTLIERKVRSVRRR
jgi:hypothetical protein